MYQLKETTVDQLIKPCQPHGQPHAIEQAIFVFELAESPKPASFEKLFNAKDSDLRKLLTADPKMVQGVSFEITTDANGPLSSSYKQDQGISGIIFERFNQNGQHEWSLQFDRERLLIVCLHYTGCLDSLEFVRKAFRALVAELQPSSLPLKGLALQFTDKFFVSEFKSGWVGQLFREETPYLMRNAHQIESLWHAHQGFFEAVNELKVLTNLNIDVAPCMDGVSVGQVTVLSNHKCADLQLVLTEMDVTSAELMLEVLHDRNKELLKDLLIDDVCKSIGLIRG